MPKKRNAMQPPSYSRTPKQKTGWTATTYRYGRAAGGGPVRVTRVTRKRDVPPPGVKRKG